MKRPSNGRQQGEALSRRCQSQEHVTEADLQQLSMQRKPSTKTAKCFHACMMESIGMVTLKIVTQLIYSIIFLIFFF